MQAAEDKEGDWPNLPAMMFGCAARWGDRPMLRHWRDRAWHGITWAEFARATAGVARGLRAQGVAAGDRVLIASENRPEVVIAETALMAICAIPLPAYTTSTTEDWAHLFRDSGARAAIVSSAALAERARAACPALDWVVRFDEDFAGWAADPSDPGDVAAEAASIAPGALACLLYTSGTSGPPLGVMLPHRAILSNIRGAAGIVRAAGLGPGGTYLSFLPLSHAYEHTVGLFLLPSLGLEVVYARGIEHLAADLLAIKPDVITVVPRMLEVLHTRIAGEAARQGGWRQALFDRTVAAGLRRLDGQATVLDHALAPALDRLVRARVRARFGGKLRAAVSGGARLDPALGGFFLALGIPILQGYGQTEAGPVVSVNPPGRVRRETVGPPLPGVELRIAEDGEILLRGDLVMDGYWNKPEATAAALRDGWLHTGDVGALDPDGYLRITDRKKDIIVLSGGEKVWPARVEGLLAGEPEIAQAVVAGDGRTGLVALLVPTEGADEPAVAKAVARVNRTLGAVERVRRHALVPPFTVENGLLTASMKVRRNLVLRAHAEALATGRDATP